VYAGLLSVLLIMTGWELPRWMQNTVSMLGDIAIPLMLITLGASLSQIKLRFALHSLGMGTMRLLLGFGIGWLVAELLDLKGLARGVLIIQSSMPVAVFNYLLPSMRNPRIMGRRLAGGGRGVFPAGQ
jgi:predicted permease